MSVPVSGQPARSSLFKERQLLSGSSSLIEDISPQYDSSTDGIVAYLRDHESPAEECYKIFRTLMEQPSVLRGKLWTTKDIVLLLSERGFDTTPEAELTSVLRDVQDDVDTDILNDGTEREWDVIRYAVNEVMDERTFIASFKD